MQLPSVCPPAELHPQAPPPWLEAPRLHCPLSKEGQSPQGPSVLLRQLKFAKLVVVHNYSLESGE